MKSLMRNLLNIETAPSQMKQTWRNFSPQFTIVKSGSQILANMLMINSFTKPLSQYSKKCLKCIWKSLKIVFMISVYILGGIYQQKLNSSMIRLKSYMNASCTYCLMLLYRSGGIQYGLLDRSIFLIQMSSRLSFSSMRLSKLSDFFNILLMLPIRKEKKLRPMNSKIMQNTYSQVVLPV